jgi:ubiquinone/menaquinone biosynthesis C-methylase UbiE
MADTPPAEYDEVAEAYGRALDRPDDDFADPLLTELTGEVAGRCVLSLACGHGRDTRMLARLGADVTGVDVSTEMLRHARRHEADDPRGITYVEGDAQELAGFEDGSFDGVLSHMALMDIPDLAATIRSVARVLRRDGWFVFSILHPCYRGHVEIVEDYLLDHRYAKRIARDWLPAHAYHRPLSAYVNTLADAGFRVERIVEAHHAPDDAGEVPGYLYARAVKQ